MDRKIASLKEENERLRKSWKIRKRVRAPCRKIRPTPALISLELRDNVQKLRGALDELRKDTSGLRTERKEKDAKINELSFRIQFLENYIGIGKKGDFSESFR